MKYIPRNVAVPVKVEMLSVPEPLKLSDDGHIVIIEQRGTHMTIKEFAKSIKEIGDKLAYFHYQLSDDNIDEIKTNIKKLTEKKRLFEDFLNNMMKEE